MTGHEFLSKVMRVAKQITRAERGMVVDHQLNVVEVLNIPQDVLASKYFEDVAHLHITAALKHNEYIITTNLISDPSQAPVTNTSFNDLRVVVVMPVSDVGAIYLDQHIRYGVIPRPTIDRLMRMMHAAREQALEHADEDELTELYKQLN
jgi:hypothetical protein